MKSKLFAALILLVSVGYLAGAGEPWPGGGGGGTGGGPGSDTTAIHDNISDEINAIAQDATPDGTDFLIGEDGTTGAKESYQIQDLPSASGGDNVRVDAVGVVDPNFDDGGDIDFTATGSPATVTAAVKPGAVVLGTQTTGGYAASTTPGGGATSLEAGALDAETEISGGLCGGGSQVLANGGAAWSCVNRAGVDSTAIHTGTASEILGIAPKTAPVGADIIVIEDSEAGHAKKRVQLGHLALSQTVLGIPFSGHLTTTLGSFASAIACRTMYIGTSDGGTNLGCASQTPTITSDGVTSEAFVPFGGGALTVQALCHRRFTTNCSGGNDSVTFNIREWTQTFTNVGVVATVSTDTDCTTRLWATGVGTTSNTDGALSVEIVNGPDTGSLQERGASCVIYFQ